MRVLYCSDILNVHDRCLLEGLASAGVETGLATFYHRRPELPAFTRGGRVFHERYRAYPDGIHASGFPLLRAWQYRCEEKKAIRKMRQWIAEWKPDVVFASWTITAGYVCARAGAKPLALYPWGSDVLLLPKERGWYRRRSVAALQAADLWACNARHTAVEAERMCGRAPRVEVLPVEVDSALFAPERADRREFEKLWPGRKVVLTSRPLKELYDHATILRAMAKVDAALYVTGEGPLRESLERSAKCPIHFAGWVEDDRLPSLLAACDVYVSASRSDSASSAVFEAMACARPVVASDIPANREWIRDGVTGRLFRTGDSDDLARVLSDVLKNPGTLGIEARKFMLEHADRRTNIPKLVAALRELK